MATSYLDEEGLRLLVQKIQAMPDGTTLEYTGGKLKLKDDILNTLGVSDHVIAEGTSGEWFYRKYASGKAESWIYRMEFLDIGGTWNGKDVGSISLPFPVKNAKAYTALPTYKGIIYGRLSASGEEYSESVGYGAIIFGVSGAANYAVGLYIVGEWK